MPARLHAQTRRAIRVHGVVQGVGFRPFVHRLALRHGLHGFVRNETGAVAIEVEGDERSVDEFTSELELEAPAQARIQGIHSEPRPLGGGTDFTIQPSRIDPAAAPSIGPDLATCAECLRELRDPESRRHRHAFTNCTRCGPRFTIVQGTPYDRERTTMAPFRFCGPCRAEYEDPGDRRHHAEATACPACGPRLTGLDLATALRKLREGGILAVKGLGGFHLACDAGNEEAVRELRRRKNRDEKPFALMVAGIEEARRLCEVSPEEAELLLGPEGPIVLLKRRAGAGVAASVAPGNPFLGLMLPYTPLHQLLMEGGRTLVMTSGNASDEPMVHRDADALRILGPVADGFLTHDREIHSRCDDSVVRVSAGRPLLLRRSRGYAPAPLHLPLACGTPTLALGGALKSVFALGRGPEAILSQHLGDLDLYEAYRAYVSTIEHYERLFHFTPGLIVHDLHPDYPSTRYALERGGVRTLAVQHHHAHLASCMAEHGLVDPVIGVTFDGTGYGSDGTIWGGEFLIGDYRSFRRAAHLESIPMPGGEAAIREPWRMAAAALACAGADLSWLQGRIPERSLELVGRLKTPLTSSCGRLFDAVSSLLGIRDRVSYEGQAAIELEWLARESSASGRYPVELSPEGVVRIGPLIGGLLDDLRRGVDRADIARRFHSTIVGMIRQVCLRLREESGLDRVVLSGGVFMNEILLDGALEGLGRDGFRVYRHRLVPPNDGGLCLGQLAIAAAAGGRD